MDENENQEQTDEVVEDKTVDEGTEIAEEQDEQEVTQEPPATTEVAGAQDETETEDMLEVARKKLEKITINFSKES